MVSIAASHTSMLIVNSDGLKASDIRPLVRFNIMVILKKVMKKEVIQVAEVVLVIEILNDTFGIKHADEALKQAHVNLEAIDAKAGMMTVVLGPGWPGVLLHEAIGHGLKEILMRKKTSAFSGLIGEQVASSQCTIVDDGTISKKRGSLSIDDEEGCVTENTMLIENGILKGYIQDKLNAKLMQTSATGNGRRELCISTYA